MFLRTYRKKAYVALLNPSFIEYPRGLPVLLAKQRYVDRSGLVTLVSEQGLLIQPTPLSPTCLCFVNLFDVVHRFRLNVLGVWYPKKTLRNTGSPYDVLYIVEYSAHCFISCTQLRCARSTKWNLLYCSWLKLSKKLQLAPFHLNKQTRFQPTFM